MTYKHHSSLILRYPSSADEPWGVGNLWKKLLSNVQVNDKHATHTHEEGEGTLVSPNLGASHLKSTFSQNISHEWEHAVWQVTLAFPSTGICRGCQIFCIKWICWTRSLIVLNRKNEVFWNMLVGRKKKKIIELFELEGIVSIKKLWLFLQKIQKCGDNMSFFPSFFQFLLLFFSAVTMYV